MSIAPAGSWLRMRRTLRSISDRLIVSSYARRRPATSPLGSVSMSTSATGFAQDASTFPRSSVLIARLTRVLKLTRRWTGS